MNSGLQFMVVVSAIACSCLVSEAGCFQERRTNHAADPVVQAALREKTEKLIALARQEQRAESRGDLRGAEEVYEKMLLAGANERTVDRDRFRLYEKEGRWVDAYNTLKIVVTNTKESSSTDAIEPRMLTEFAEVAERFGKHDEAMDVYRKVLHVARNCYRSDFAPELDRDESDEQVRAAAHYMTGMTWEFSSGGPECLRQMRLATKLAPTWALGHYGLGHVLLGMRQFPEAKVEMNRAISLADRRLKAAIRRATRGISYLPAPASNAPVGTPGSTSPSNGGPKINH